VKLEDANVVPVVVVMALVVASETTCGIGVFRAVDWSLLKSLCTLNEIRSIRPSLRTKKVSTRNCDECVDRKRTSLEQEISHGVWETLRRATAIVLWTQQSRIIFALVE